MKNIRAAMDTNALLLMVFLAIFTIVFSFMAMSEEKDVVMINKGDSEREDIAAIRPDKSLFVTKEEIKQIIDEKGAKVDNLYEAKKAQYKKSLELSSYGISFKNGEQVGKSIMSRWTEARESVEHDNKIITTWDKSMADTERHDLVELDVLIKETRKAMDEIIRKKRDEDESFLATQDRLKDEEDKINDYRDEQRKINKEKSAALLTKKTRLEEKIRELLELKLRWLKEVEVDGVVLEAAEDGEYVVVNLGYLNGLKAGIKFELFALTHGKHITKAYIEVIKVEDRISTCRVTTILGKKLNQVAPGDKIGNPVYSAGRAKTFVLAGEFDKYNKTDLANFIKLSGAKVVDKLGPNVDFLIAGAGSASEKAQKEAREYHVKAMTENRLLLFVQPQFQPKKMVSK